MKYLILSTYPFNGSLNSGDDLLEKSLIKLIKESDNNADFVIKFLNDTTFSIIDLSDFDAVAGIASITSQWSQQRENLITLLKTVLKQDIPVYLILVSKFSPITVNAIKKVQIDHNLKRLFQAVSKKGTFVTRDLFTLKLARDNGITCKGCIGDIALYDSAYIEKPLQSPATLKTVAISLPHNTYWNKSAIKLAQKLQKKYGCQCVLTTHGISDLSNITSEINKLKLPVINLSGGAENLDYYKTVDMHIGFRLHAHIYCLRIRKPSVLAAEDSRAGGHLHTFKGAGYNATPRLIEELNDSNRTNNRFYPILHKYYYFNMAHAWRAITREIRSQFHTTKKNLQLVDKYYHQKVLPFMHDLTNTNM